jgi:HEAT repeat protein
MPNYFKERGNFRPSAKICDLIEILCGANATQREHTRKALVAEGKAAVKPLIELLTDPRPHVRWEAAKALSDIGDPAAANALVEALDDEESDVRWLAAVGLVAMKHKGLKALLLALIERPDTIWLREGAHHICHELVRKELFRQLVPLLKALEQPDPEVSVPLAAYDVMCAMYSYS